MSGREIPELSRTEPAAWAKFKAQLDSVREAILTGDRSLVSTEPFDFSDMDGARYRDALHVPEGAGDHEAALVGMLRRIPDGWGRFVSFDAGWYLLVVVLDSELAALDPDYSILQMKEKYGTLHFYAKHTLAPNTAEDVQFRDLISAARTASSLLCERCGSLGSMHRSAPFHWAKTLCERCACPVSRILDRFACFGGIGVPAMEGV